MQGVSSMSVVVKANGVSEAFYNGQRDRVVEAVRAEAAERIRKANRETKIQRDRADSLARTCNCFRAEKLAVLNAQMNRRPSIFQRIESAWAYAFATACAAVFSVWCYLYAYTRGSVWIDILLNLGMIERVDD